MLIYEIKNKINGKSYVGQHSGKDFNSYWGSGKLIKKAIEKYGIDNFEKFILEECFSKEELNEKEIYWIEQKGTLKNGYNLTKGGTGGDTSRFINYSEDWRNKQAEGAKIYWDNLSQEGRELRAEKISGDKNPMFGKTGFWKDKSIPKDVVKKAVENRRSFKGDQNPNWKGGKSTVKCACGKDIKPEQKYCNKCRPRDGKNNSFYGKCHSEDTKNKIRNSKLGKKPANMKQVVIDEISYESLSEASRVTGLHSTTILWRIKSKNKKFENYKYKTNN